MTALLRALPGPRGPSWRCLGLVLRATHSRNHRGPDREGARLQAGGGGPPAAYGPAPRRGLHAESAPEPVEVDVKRLEGGDAGREPLRSSQT